MRNSAGLWSINFNFFPNMEPATCPYFSISGVWRQDTEQDFKFWRQSPVKFSPYLLKINISLLLCYAEIIAAWHKCATYARRWNPFWPKICRCQIQAYSKCRREKWHTPLFSVAAKWLWTMCEKSFQRVFFFFFKVNFLRKLPSLRFITFCTA